MSEEAEAAFEKFINKDYNMYKQNIETVKSRVNAALIAHNVKK